ncbi:MAG: hypothetical protein GY711_22590 [bacterium]|nr:hypothetical protein [bacterium]
MVITSFALLACMQTPATLESCIERFLAAPPGTEREAAMRDVLETRPDFDEVYALLERGRAYPKDVPTGRILRERTGTNGLRQKRYFTRVDLHGGMGATEWKELGGSWSPGWKPLSDQIVIVPAGWWDSMWWEWSPAENLEAILSEAKRTWNVDENRVVLTGSSDGGIALFFQASGAELFWFVNDDQGHSLRLSSDQGPISSRTS